MAAVSQKPIKIGHLVWRNLDKVIGFKMTAAAVPFLLLPTQTTNLGWG